MLVNKAISPNQQTQKTSVLQLLIQLKTKQT